MLELTMYYNPVIAWSYCDFVPVFVGLYADTAEFGEHTPGLVRQIVGYVEPVIIFIAVVKIDTDFPPVHTSLIAFSVIDYYEAPLRIDRCAEKSGEAAVVIGIVQSSGRARNPAIALVVPEDA